MQTIQTVRSMGRKHKQIARCTGSKKELKQFRSARPFAYGFLRHSFLPLFEEGKKVPDQSQVERDFFNSLAILTRLYGFEVLNMTGKSYPYNILLAHANIQKQLNSLSRDIELSIMQSASQC